MALLFWYIAVLGKDRGKYYRRRRNQRGGLAVFIGESRFSWNLTNLEVIRLTDEELLGLYFARSEEAIRATGMVYGPYCRAIALRILDSEEDAEECLADVWLRVWNAVPPERPEHFKGWLGVITRNQALTLLLQGAEAPAGGGGGPGAGYFPVQRSGGRAGGQGTGAGRLRFPCGPAGEKPGRVPPPVLVWRHGGGGRTVGGLEPQPDEICAVPDAEEIEGLSEKGGALS